MSKYKESKIEMRSYMRIEAFRALTDVYAERIKSEHEELSDVSTHEIRCVMRDFWNVLYDVSDHYDGYAIRFSNYLYIRPNLMKVYMNLYSALRAVRFCMMEEREGKNRKRAIVRFKIEITKLWKLREDLWSQYRVMQDQYYREEVMFTKVWLKKFKALSLLAQKYSWRYLK